LAVALALQDTLSNLFAGLQIIASRQVRVGDYIKLDSGQEGYVTDIRWRNTTIRALPNNMVIIPNNKLSSAITTNFYQPVKEMGFGVPVSVAYGSDLDYVEKVTLEVAREVMQEVEGGVPTAQPGFGFSKFGDSAIEFNVGLRCQEFVNQYRVTHEFIKRLHRRYQQEGIDIPYPIRTVYLKSEQAPEQQELAPKDGNKKAAVTGA
jgi:small-conductance mechanosensitive channel